MFPKNTVHVLKIFAVLTQMLLQYLVFLTVPERQQKTFHSIATDP